MQKKSKDLCVGCHNNFYNGNNDIGVKECWSYKSSKVMKRYTIGWWTPMDKKENFKEVITLDCKNNSGKILYLDNLPKHLR